MNIFTVQHDVVLCCESHELEHSFSLLLRRESIIEYVNFLVVEGFFILFAWLIPSSIDKLILPFNRDTYYVTDFCVRSQFITTYYRKDQMPVYQKWNSIINILNALLDNSNELDTNTSFFVVLIRVSILDLCYRGTEHAYRLMIIQNCLMTLILLYVLVCFWLL